MFRCNATPSPTGWCNTKFDGSVVDNQQTLDPNQRIADIKAAQAQFYSEVPAFYVDRRTVWVFTATNFQDFRFANAGIPLVDRMWIQSRSTANTTPPTSPPPTTVTTRPPPTTVPPTTTTTFRPVTTTTKPVTTTAKPTTTTAKGKPATTVAPTTINTVGFGNDVVTVTVPPTTPSTEGVALPATPASSEHKPVPVGLLLLVVLLAVIFGVASTAAFMVWRQGRGW
jgi:hypothetical protein